MQMNSRSFDFSQDRFRGNDRGNIECQTRNDECRSEIFRFAQNDRIVHSWSCMNGKRDVLWH